jgi:hypothetical protein
VLSVLLVSNDTAGHGAAADALPRSVAAGRSSAAPRERGRMQARGTESSATRPSHGTVRRQPRSNRARARAAARAPGVNRSVCSGVASGARSDTPDPTKFVRRVVDNGLLRDPLGC